MNNIVSDVCDPRYIRDYKCQVSVGELYRWILAKLTDKEIKRALHKYRDLMPRQSDWNRKLTQATNIPELGFRYLYRCGQIDESNHRTMQKMLKYIDRQDVLPYFDTILYNSNNANASIKKLKSVLIDKVESHLMQSDLDSDALIYPEPAYEISQCQPLESVRITRSHSKRKSTSDDLRRCVTVAKKPRRNSLSGSAGASGSNSSSGCHAGSTSGASTAGSNPSSPLNAADYINVLIRNAVQAAVVVPQQAQAAAGGQQQVVVLDVIGQRPGPRPPAVPIIPPMRPLPPAPLPNVAMAGGHYRLNGGGLGVSLSSESGGPYFCRLRMRIRMHQPVIVQEILRGVRSDRQDAFERQLDIFSQTSNQLRQREAGEVVCDVRFTDLQYLESFWRDYVTGALKQSMRDILLMEPGGRLAGDLHISISQQEYEIGRDVLIQNLSSYRSSSSQGTKTPPAPAPWMASSFI